MKDLKINHLAAVVAIVLHQLIPMGWYTIFQEKWMALTEITQAEAESGGASPYIISLICAAITVYGMAYLFTKLPIDSALKGVQTAALFWLAFVFAQIMIQNTFSMRSMELTFIDQGNTFLTFIVTGALLGGWRKPSS